MFNCSIHEYNQSILHLYTPIEIQVTVGQWQLLKNKMIYDRPNEFTRTEWAYLINFISSSNLNNYIANTFGPKKDCNEFTPDLIMYPEKKIALWLPNNVSLLGPLTLILISLTGAELKIKAGSSGKNLISPFLEWIHKNADENELAKWIKNKINVYNFDRTNEENSQFSQWADVRILFGSDEAAHSIEKLSHPTHSKGIYFTNKSSEIWIDNLNLTDNTLADICKIVEVYGLKGCTSPKRICLIDGNESEAYDLAKKIATRWENLTFSKPEQNVASNNFLNNQLCLANGLSSILAGQNGVNICVSSATSDIILGHMQINIQFGTFEEFNKTLPSNIQTIGVSLSPNNMNKLLPFIHIKNISRIVPIIKMHNFDIHWDSIFWWKSLFKTTQVEK